jgi:uncharacterized protein (DUF1786 family)
VKVLAVDIGTGTQDILLFDTEREPENCLKLVMPSPTMRLAEAIRAATAAGRDIVLTGVTMGGGPCGWAAEDHLSKGYRLFATPDAAKTFNDDLAEVEALGVVLIGEDQVGDLPDAVGLEMRDLDYASMAHAFDAFGVDLDQVDAVAVAVFDHGAAPPGVSDRLFRFEYLAERIEAGGGLSGFAFQRDAIPTSMTRLQAAASSVPGRYPVVAMDTAPAAVLGALEDPHVRRQQTAIVANVGNFHTLAFRLPRTDGESIAGLFEHHTGRLTRSRLEKLLGELASGTISNDELFAEHGHGALVLDPQPVPLEFLAVTGPRRGLLASSVLRPYMAVPHGDMMMAGCWGLVRACSRILPWTTGAIQEALEPGDRRSS